MTNQIKMKLPELFKPTLHTTGADNVPFKLVLLKQLLITVYHFHSSI